MTNIRNRKIQEVQDMYRVVFKYDDNTEDEIYVESLSEAQEYENDENFAYIETV